MPKRKKSGSTSEKRTAATDPKNDDHAWSKSKKKRMRLKKRPEEKAKNTTTRGTDDKKLDESLPRERESHNQKPLTITDTKTNNGTANETLNVRSSRPRSALQEAFIARLSGSRFRELNEVRRCVVFTF